MAKMTTNLGLVKPDATDPVSITQLNDNFDKIDAKLGNLSTELAEANKSTFEWDSTTSTLTINI